MAKKKAEAQGKQASKPASRKPKKPASKPATRPATKLRPKKPSPAKADQADKARTQRRIDDILRIRLDGAQWWDVREFVREKEKEEGSAWFVAPGSKPLCDATIRTYQTRADEEMVASHERSRKKLIRRHTAQRRNLYARAATSGDLRTALACLEDEADLLGLYPPKRVAVGGDKNGEPISYILIPGEQPPAPAAPAVDGESFVEVP